MRDLNRFLSLFRQYMANSDQKEGYVEKCLAQALETPYFMRYNADLMVPKGLLLPY